MESAQDVLFVPELGDDLQLAAQGADVRGEDLDLTPFEPDALGWDWEAAGSLQSGGGR
ncbi:hypothetical protein ACFV9E_16240 [Streptomyces sp. NPDC059835]|uniref:hypothetical protein n=1 Tax=Streptomyces sp. NPDC059835 TaxID=3346967 RepID=UPI0036606600